VAISGPRRRACTKESGGHSQESASGRSERDVAGRLGGRLGADPAALVVELSWYADANGIRWAAGASAPATRIR